MISRANRARSTGKQGGQRGTLRVAAPGALLVTKLHAYLRLDLDRPMERRSTRPREHALLAADLMTATGPTSLMFSETLAACVTNHHPPHTHTVGQPTRNCSTERGPGTYRRVPSTATITEKPLGSIDFPWTSGPCPSALGSSPRAMLDQTELGRKWDRKGSNSPQDRRYSGDNPPGP
jgi:hypothetical protein